jgi:DNA-binding transcriptional MerR regulator
MLTMGELAARAGVPTPTVRYHERRGLIAEAPRTPWGYRRGHAPAPPRPCPRSPA